MLPLFLGDFERGWRGYEWRWVNARRLGIGDGRTFAAPRWLGEEPIAGKRIFPYTSPASLHGNIDAMPPPAAGREPPLFLKYLRPCADCSVASKGCRKS